MPEDFDTIDPDEEELEEATGNSFYLQLLISLVLISLIHFLLYYWQFLIFFIFYICT